MNRWPLLAATLALCVGCKGNMTSAPANVDPNTDVPPEVEDLPPSVVPDPDETVYAFLPRRIRRLTNAELERALSELAGEPIEVASRLPEDTRQRYFRLNDAQVVDPLFATGLSELAREAADSLASRDFDGVVSCATRDDACARSSLEGFAERAWRRPLEEDELDALASLFALGSAEGGFEEGMTWAIEGVLQAPGLLYATELGASRTDSGTVVLSPWEVATQLALVTTGAPPDDALLEAARDGSILEPSVRGEHARRLLDGPAGKLQQRELVMQWLGLDTIGQTSKDANAYPEYMTLQGAILKEAEDFIDEVVATGGGVEELLGADYTIVENQQLAQLYGLGGQGRLDLSGTPRRGILSQAGFLSVHSNPNDSGPIHRGVSVIERVLCVELVTPGELDIQVTPPEPDPNATTRERFAQHSADPACAGCHAGIDGVGFAFEHFDPIGRLRETDNGRPVDTLGELLYTEAAAPYPSSFEMIQAIAPSEAARRCFAQNAFGFASARDDEEVVHGFQTLWDAGAPSGDRLDDALIFFIESDLFIHRSAS